MDEFLFVSYREWAFKSYLETGLQMHNVQTTEALLTYLHTNEKVKYIFFVGWSELIPEEIVNKYCCLCIHPSMLPLYRGGSPIQNQIIDGVLDSGVSLFKMDNGIDTGPIFSQLHLSLRGTLDDIFLRIIFIASQLIREFVQIVLSGKEVNFKIQNDDFATYFKRRKPSESEITLKDLQTLSTEQLYNKIRSLDDPYPNAYIKCADGGKLFLKKVSIG
jgi:methionyl-tRNA formyltransferase